MDHVTYHPVRDLLAEPATRALIDNEDDRRLLATLTNVCQEFSYHRKNVLDEPPLLFELHGDAAAQQYHLWFLYPPAVQGFSFHQLSRIFALGRPYVRADEILLEIETGEREPRLALTVTVAKTKSTIIPEIRETLIVSTTVVHHAANSSLVGADVPGGLAVRRKGDGPVLDNRNTPRPPTSAPLAVVGRKRPLEDGGGGEESAAKRGRFDQT